MGDITSNTTTKTCRGKNSALALPNGIYFNVSTYSCKGSGCLLSNATGAVETYMSLTRHAAHAKGKVFHVPDTNGTNYVAVGGMVRSINSSAAAAHTPSSRMWLRTTPNG